MTKWRRSALNVLASLIVPFIVQAGWIVFERTFRPELPSVIATYSFLLGAVVGFVWLIYEFRIYSLLIAVIYFPLMSFLLFGFSLDFVGNVYGTWP
jgi:hypothetical protein